MVKRIILFIPLALSAGCDFDLQHLRDKQVKDCHYVVTHLARSPSTVQFIRTDVFDYDPNSKDVRVEFDAQNAMGGTVRTSAKCSYSGVNGEYAKETEDVEWNGQRIDDLALITVRLKQRGDVAMDLID